MNNVWAGSLVILGMIVFYFIVTRRSRRQDVFKQLADTIGEMKQDTYQVLIDKNDGREMLVLKNSTARINIMRYRGREELEISLFLPDSELEGSNNTKLSRTVEKKNSWSNIAYRRTNRLRGRLLYFMTGSLQCAKAQTLFSETIRAAYAHLDKNAQTASS